MIPFSFVKNKPNDTVLDSTKQYLNPSQNIQHSDDLGNSTGAQLFVVKKVANGGALNISIVPNNGQSLVVAFSLSRQALLNWIQTSGASVANLTAYTIPAGDQSFIKTIDESPNPEYIWFAVAEDSTLGTGATHGSYTYTVTYSGNYTSPESLLKSEGTPGPPATGTYLNPTIISIPTTVQYDASYGECIDGLYYFTYQSPPNIPTNLHITSLDSSDFGFIISTSKLEIKNWAQSGGVASIPNSTLYTSTGGTLDIAKETTANTTLYAAFYNPSAIGVSSCVGGKKFTIQSSREVYNGSSTGTYANPVIINNNVKEVDALTLSRGAGECRMGGFYYVVNSCYGSNLEINMSSENMSTIGIGISTDQTKLANFLRTGNYGQLDYYTNAPGSTTYISFTSYNYLYYIVIFDPNNIGANCCGSSDTFKMWTKQLNCAGGGSGRDGRYNTPYTWSNAWYNVIHADGDCDIDGRIWFEVAGLCGRNAISPFVSAENGQRIGVAWSTDQAAIKNFLDTNLGSVCGSFDTPSDEYNSNYTSEGIVYYNVGWNTWVHQDYYFNVALLGVYPPNYTLALTSGYFDNLDYNTSLQ
jgi:hypothetical protein